jgi:hypothetical protein
MMKNVLRKMDALYPDPLAIIGWLAFGFGILTVQSVWLKLLLLSAARVLPWTLHEDSPALAQQWT